MPNVASRRGTASRSSKRPGSPKRLGHLGRGAPALISFWWWASKLDDRIFALETHLSQFDLQVIDQLTQIEANQQNVLHRLDDIDAKLDSMRK
jgi:hypothetical protein